jgi:hypothetical protein
MGDASDRDLKRLERNLTENVSKLLANLYTKLIRKIMGPLDDLKAQLATANEKIDIIVPATLGIKKDVALLKKKLEAAGVGGINAAGVAELKAIVNPMNDKLTSVAADLQALDAETAEEQES